mgnify:CR=1 FL=1|jgi:hypothetical protein
MSKPKITPWHQFRWAWIVFGLPTIVVVASVITFIIAMRTDDGVVTDDYYKKGLAINQDLDRERKASELGLVGELTMSGATLELRLTSTQPNGVIGQPLKFTAQNYAAKDQDQSITLLPSGDGVWRGTLTQAMGMGHWQLIIESNEWRLESDSKGNVTQPLMFKAGV